MKIKLINPPSPFLTNERVFSNMGLVRVATELKQRNYDTEIIDLAGNTNQIIPESDVYGFSSTTPQFPYVYNLLKYIKKSYPNSHTVIGGPHATALYHLKEKGIEDINIEDLNEFDTIFAGEGELNNVELMFKKGWQKAPLIKNIDDILIPDRDLIDIKSYHYKLNNEDTTNIQSQRGCPGKCTFCCGRDIEMYNRTRQHSPERVLEELDMLNKKYNYSSFMWYDDEVNINMNRLENLCSMLSKRNYKHRGFIRSDQLVKHSESINWLKQAGFVKLCAGVESGSKEMLQRINKQTTPEMNSKAREIVKRANIHYESFMILGHPGEAVTDIYDTYKWLKENKPDDFDINICTPYPGSKMYNEAKPSNEFEGYDWEYNRSFFNKPRYAQEDSFYKGKNAQSHSGLRTKSISNKVLKKLRNIMDKELRKK